MKEKKCVDDNTRTIFSIVKEEEDVIWFRILKIENIATIARVQLIIAHKTNNSYIFHVKDMKVWI